MNAPMGSGIAVREVFHLLLLRHLAESRGTEGWALKGGVNLRLFFGSVRYSEDMDLDAEPRLRRALKRDLLAILRDVPFRRRLMDFGVRAMEPDQPRLSKDTETTGRIKLALVVGGVPLHTKIDLSFRLRDGRDAVECAAPDPSLALRYLTKGKEYPFVVPHYPRTAAVRRKISALAGRRTTQARDVFDLVVLAGGTHTNHVTKETLRKYLSNTTLREAVTRTLAMPEGAFQARVLEFLDEADRTTWAGRWDELRLFVVDLADELFGMPGGPAEPGANGTDSAEELLSDGDDDE